MPINVDINQALILLGAKTLELAQIQAQAEAFAEEFNKLKNENEALKEELKQWRTGQSPLLPISTPTS
jgi:cell division protein FtsB